MPKVKRRYRSAETGEFVSKEEAEKHPKETVSEKIDTPPKENGDDVQIRDDDQFYSSADLTEDE